MNKAFRPRKLRNVNEFLELRRRRESGWTTAKLSCVYGISESMVRRHTKDLGVREKPGTKRVIDYTYIANHPELDAATLARKFGVTRRGIQKARERLRDSATALVPTGIPHVADGFSGAVCEPGGP